MSVHNHPPYRPVCNERRVNGQLRGACLTDEGDPVSDTKPDLDAIEARSAASVESEGKRDWHRAIGATADDVPALVAYARTLEAEVERLSRVDLEPSRQMLVDDAESEAQFHSDRAEAAEAERDQLRDTLARRSAAHDRLTQRLDQIRHEVETYRAAMPAFSALYSDHRGILTDDARRRAHLALTYPRDVLDGDQRTEQP